MTTNTDTTTEYCGCCGGDATEAPKGEHAECCDDLHDVKAELTEDNMTRDRAEWVSDREYIIPATPLKTADELHAMVDSYKRVPLNRARQLLAIANSETGKRDYLHSVGSGYANADYEIMTGAFNGRVLQALASLADAYQQEITHA